ncbi:MAG: hypothetical protein A2176_08270 [Spirochaetes bacterium RBG_13_51_14]|nr:MAG: hypothetical protein A2176_08270 [Spirochaetes bacterium RBG_13_51_14]
MEENSLVGKTYQIVQALWVFIILFVGCSLGFDNARIHSLNIEAKRNYGRGVQYAREREADRAIESFTKSIEIDPSAAAYNGRAAEYLRKGWFEDAVSDASRAIMLNEKYAISYFNRGCAYYKMGDFNRALKEFTRAVYLDDGQAEFYFNLAQTYVRLGLEDEALGMYGRTLERNPHYYAAYYNRACLYSQMRKFPEAIANLEMAVKEGFADVERMKRESALEKIRNTPAFNILLQKLGSKPKK